ncbi:hypothetical protein J4207_03600 [Candidatus Woesearchaeota archaeon]|nr:hypothetical protein [Candidatus Woesearchaeota archaeon]
MKGNLTLYYDEEGDFLEFHVGEFTEGSFRNFGKGVFERIDKKTGEVKGLAIMGFKARTSKLEDVKITLPVGIELVQQA